MGEVYAVEVCFGNAGDFDAVSVGGQGRFVRLDVVNGAVVIGDDEAIAAIDGDDSPFRPSSALSRNLLWRMCLEFAQQGNVERIGGRWPVHDEGTCVAYADVASEQTPESCALDCAEPCQRDVGADERI